MLRRLLLAAIVASPALLAAGSHLPLGGTWEFQLDPQKTGHAERWFERRLGPDTIFLPGSTDQGGYGTKVVTPEKGYLTRPYKYEGLAWYQKEVVIPETWRGEAHHAVPRARPLVHRSLGGRQRLRDPEQPDHAARV